MDYIYIYSQIPLIFAVQTTLHSIIAAIIVEWVLIYWNIKNPEWCQNFLSVVIILPPLTFFLYLLIDSEHYLFNLNNKYIFQSYHWIYLKIGNFYPFALFILIIFILMTCFFFIQEIFPILFFLINKNKNHYKIITPSDSSFKKALADIKLKENYQLNIIDEQDYVVYSQTGRINNIYISRGVIEKLNTEQLKGIILHEIAHIERNKKNYILIIYILRIISFFNPIILYEFRRLLQEEEKICDLWARKQLKNKRALAEALYILYIKNRKKYIKATNFKEYSAYYNMKKRIRDLRVIENCDNHYTLLALIIMIITVINYYIV
jgi:beta-lactamase regulating signal transducer with metallopeptidase domain